MAHRKSLDESRTAGLRHKRGHGGSFGGLSEFVGSKRHMLFIWFVANVFDGNRTAFKTKNGDVGYFGWLLRGLLECTKFLELCKSTLTLMILKVF